MEKFKTGEELNNFLKTVKDYGDLSRKEFIYIQNHDYFLFHTEEGQRVWSPFVEDDQSILSTDEYSRIPNEDDLFIIKSEIEHNETYLKNLKDFYDAACVGNAKNTDNTVYFQCLKCGKKLFTMEDYNNETEDVPYGFEWTVEHKREFCKYKKD